MQYNWLRAELISYQLLDGRASQGILYKPENLDRGTKYPMIVHFYERRSDDLNTFKHPHLSEGEMNIPWYVSNGYLVFVPDIQYKTGHNDESITASVLSGLDALSNYTYIDFSRLGVQGHSMGGYQTNVLITKTNVFKCAQESAGPVDEVTSFFGLEGDHTRQAFGEFDQPNLGTQPWANPQTFIRNSPVYEIEKVNTPLLIMHNQNDSRVKFSHAQALFTGLRRLQKPVWLLSYPDEGHDLMNENNQLDYNIKQQEFFNYYLKGKPLPGWMK